MMPIWSKGWHADLLASMLRRSRAGVPDYEQAMQRLDAYSEEEAAAALERVAAAINALVLLDEVEGFAGVRRRWMRSSVGGASSLCLPKSLATWDLGDLRGPEPRCGICRDHR